MQIDKELLSKLEKLSSLKIDEEHKDGMIEDLSNIVAFVENLNELDVENVSATFTTVEGGTPFREDIPSNSPEISNSILKNAPNSHESFFVVPKIIE